MFLSAALSALMLAQTPAPKPFEFKDGDRIVWLGGTLVEREQRHGYWETALLSANADKRITVRNLGWSGDTVFGEARGRFDFDKPDVCFKQLVDQTLALKPTVIFICYGTNESFEGKEGLPKFEKGLAKLLDALKPAKARIVLFSPLPVNPFETPAGLPDPKARNAILKTYGETIRAVAERRGHQFADLNKFALEWFSAVKQFIERTPKRAAVMSHLTENGMHLTSSGYGSTVMPFMQSLGFQLESDFAATLITRYDLLRQAVIAKNQLFFYRWRPQNETYLFGFRKHEQGKNAREVAEFDPLVAKAEEEVERIRKTLK